MAQFFQIQNLDDLKLYADVQVVHVDGEDVGNHSRPQQLLLQDESILLNEGQQVVYQTTTSNPQYQQQATAAHFIIGDEQQQQQPQSQQVLLQHQSLEHHRVSQQSPMQTQQIYQQDTSQQTQVQQLQQDQHQLQHVQAHQQQVYYTTSEQLLQQNPIVQQQQQPDMQQQQLQHVHSTQQQQHYPTQQQQIVHQQHTMQSATTQQVQVQQSPQQQIVYRMQTQQQPPQQMHQSTQVMNNTHVIVQQPNGQVLIHPQQIQAQRILYNTNRMYNTPQTSQSNQIHTILQQSQQHMQLQTHARLLHRAPSQSQAQQTPQPAPQQSQQPQHNMTPNVVFHQIQQVQKPALPQPLQQQQQQQQQQSQLPVQHVPAQASLLNATLGGRGGIRIKAPRGGVNSSTSSPRLPTSSVRLPLRTTAPIAQQPTPAATRNPRVRNPGAGTRARGGGRGRGSAPNRIVQMSTSTVETGIQTSSTSVQTQSGISHITATPIKTLSASGKQYYRIDPATAPTPQSNLPLYQSTPRTGGTVPKLRLPVATNTGSTQISSSSSSSTVSASFEGDLEESIEAVIVKKEQQKPVSTATGTTLTTYFSKDEDENRFVHTNNGHVMTLSEFKKRNPTMNPISNNMRGYARTNNTSPTNPPALPKATTATTTINSIPASGLLNAQRGPLQKVARPQPVVRSTPPPNPPPPMSSAVHQTSHNNYEIQTQHVLQNRSGHHLAEKDRNSAKMLVILVSGEQRLITFTLPRESCTVQDLLEQVSVPFDSSTTIQCVENPGANIDFVVTVGFSVQESASELISRAEASLQMTRQESSAGVPASAMPLAGNSSSAPATTNTMYSNTSANTAASTTNSPDESVAANTFGASTASSNLPTAANKSADEPQRKVITGYYAICQSCGFSGYDHAKCERCKRIFLEPPKRVPCVKISSTGMDSHSSKSAADAAERKRGCEIAARASAKTGTTYHNVGGPAATRGRGGLQRGRATRSGRKHAETETVILTLSSDEEPDEDTNSKSSTNMGANAPSSNPASPTPHKPFLFEPFLIEKEEDDIYDEFVRGNVLDITKCEDKRVVSLRVKTVRIASYRYDTKEKVTFTSNGISLIAPVLTNPKETFTLNILRKEVVKVIAHFAQTGVSLVAIYVLRRCAEYIKESLNIPDCDENAPFYSANGQFQMRKIVLQINGGVPKEERDCILCFWENLDEISQDDARELLMRAAKTEKRISDLQQTTTQLTTGDARQLLIYPSGKGGISIGTEDYLCLAADQYLNDIIIDFYLKWVHDNIVPEALRGRTHIFSTFFYKRLTTLIRSNQYTDKDVKPTAAQKRHARVANWTKNVNLFEKDFIIIPINEQSHWFLAIICFPKLKGPVTYDTCIPVDIQQIRKQRSKKISVQIGSTTITAVTKRESNSTALAEACAMAEEDSERDEAEGDESDLASEESEADNATAGTSTESTPSATSATPPNLNSSFEDDTKPLRIKQPMILIFDSLAGASRSRVVATLRDYLTCEYKLKMPDSAPHVFNKDNMPGHCVKVPQQNNFTDCGLYLLQYVENFFLDPIRDYKVPIKQLHEWFDTLTVTRKREDISNLLQRLMDEKNGKNKVVLPEIPFPTLNGELVEAPEGYNIEFEPEEDMDEEGIEEEEEEEDISGNGGEVEMNSSTEDASEKLDLKIAAASAVVPTQGRKIVVKRRLQTVEEDGEVNRTPNPRAAPKSRRVED